MKKLIASLAALLLALAGLLFADPLSEEPAAGGNLAVHFIDVGQADAILIESGGEYLLIDGGNVADGELLVSYLTQQGVEKLTLVCTHAHEDHVGGLPAVLSVFEAEAVYAPVTDYSSKVFRDFVEKTEDQGLTLTAPKPGDRLSVGDALLTVLGPVESYDEPNNTSIVLGLSYGDSDFLFTGDMETEVENDMLDYWGDQIDWQAEVLKVGHHGSDTSTGYRFLYEVDPDYGVISVGTGNSYGHPNEEPLSRLRDAGAMVLRTDELGHVIARTDGREITFTWENQSAAPAEAEPAEVIFYGNKKTKKVHASDCKSLPAEANRVEFDSLDAALAEGYSPCGSCIGN